MGIEMAQAAMLGPRQNFLAAMSRLRAEAMAASANPLLPSPRLAEQLAIWTMCDGVENSGPDKLRSWQVFQLDALISHAVAHSPFWRARLAAWDGDLSNLPILNRAQARSQVEAEGALPAPDGHGRIGTRSTSGSTGQPLSVYASEWATALAQSLYEKHILEAGVDFSKPLINALMTSPTASQARWGGNIGELFETGPAASHSARVSDLPTLIAMLNAYPGAVINTSAAVVAAIVDLWETLPDHAQKPLSWILLNGSKADEILRARAVATLGARFLDRYSCEEMGPIALECTACPDHYHVSSSNVVVETVRFDGSPAEAGELGRVIITGLHSFPTPLIRYEIGDLAALSDSCSCGHQGPSMSDLVGRGREWRSETNGWLMLRARELLPIAPIHEYRLVRHQLSHYELEVVMPARLLSHHEREALAALVQSKTVGEMQVDVTQRERIDWGSGYKRREFVDHVAS